MTNHLDEALPAEELTYDKYLLRALLSSPGSGAGKTTSAVTVPGRKLLLDLDNRSEVIAGEPNVEIIKCHVERSSPDAWKKVDNIKDELWALARKPESFPYDAVIADGNTALWRICMVWALLLDPKRGLGGCPAKQHYGPQMKNATDWTLSMLGLPCHVIFTGHEDIIKEPDGTLNCWMPKVTGNLKTEVPKWFNETFYCWRESVAKSDGTTGYKFYWSTQGSGKREYLKSSLNHKQQYWSDPIEIDFGKEFVGFEELLVKRFGDEAKKDILEKRSS
jgi:hypothetical protein